MITVIRLIALQILWYIFIKFGDDSLAITFPLIALIMTSIDKHFFIKEASWKIYTIFTLFLFVSGLVIDSTLLNLGFINFSAWESSYSPFYMWGIWIIFFPYYSIAFKKFHHKKVIALICVFLFAPFSYYSGSKIGSLNILELKNLIYIGLMWGVFFPTSVQLYFKLMNQLCPTHGDDKM